MASPANGVEGRTGDWLVAHDIHGGPSRRGQVLEVIGEAGHHRYRVRWDEAHESIVFPADGVVIERARRRPRRT